MSSVAAATALSINYFLSSSAEFQVSIAVKAENMTIKHQSKSEIV